MKSLALVMLTAAGCAHHDARQTIVTAPLSDVADGVSIYRLSDGEVRVAMLPMVQLPALWLGQQATRALHVRVIFANKGHAEWTVFPRQQLGHVDGNDTLSPTAAPLEAVIIAPGKSQVMDLFYAARSLRSGPEAPSRFTLDWQIDQPSLLVTGNTRLDPSQAMTARSHF
jgi:hypothetical protein